MTEIENLQKELKAIQSNMNKELMEFQKQFEEDDKQTDDIDIRKFAAQKKPMDFDLILQKLQSQKQNVQQLEDELVQQQKQVELLLQDEKKDFVIQNPVQYVQNTNIASLDVLDDLDKKIANMLEENDDVCDEIAQNTEQNDKEST